MKIQSALIKFLILLSMISCTEKINDNAIVGILYSDDHAVSIEISEGKITKITPLSSDSELPKFYVAPGLIDIQINGYMGVNFSDQELTVEKMQKATTALWKEGVTTYLPTVITRDEERLLKSFSLLAKARENQEINVSVPGFHLEGPYISPDPGFRGAHNEKYIRPPDWAEFTALQKAAHDKILLITLAPEQEGAIPFIQQNAELGLIVSLGHHNGTPENIEQAVGAGAVLSTHLGNGCANMINRHNNPLWPQLSNDGLSISIIVDGAHLTKEEVRTFYKAKGKDKTILVSDALALAGLPPGKYLDDGDTLLLTEDVVKFPAENVLAGAAQPISRCVGNLMKFTDCSLEDAIQTASTNPAALMGWTDRGEIAVGKRADLVLFTLEEGKMVIQKTIVSGETVYSK